MERYPALFDKENPKPLKVGVGKELFAAFEEAGLCQDACVFAMHKWANRAPYLTASVEGAARYGLDMQAAGVVTAAQAELARTKLKFCKSPKDKTVGR